MKKGKKNVNLSANIPMIVHQVFMIMKTDKKVDIAITGAGPTGLSTAWFLFHGV